MFFAGQSLPPRSSNSTPISQPGSMNPGMTFTSSPENHPAPNPLSLIMSQMSKYAMPSSTPLYHDAIKTIATSDDEMLPDRPLLSGVSIGGMKQRHIVIDRGQFIHIGSVEGNGRIIVFYLSSMIYLFSFYANLCSA